MRRLAHASILALVVGAAGCGGPEFEVGGDGGVAPDASVADATVSPDGSVSPPSDGATGSGDAGGTGDAGDGAAIVDGGADARAFSCATQPSVGLLFCSDFDDAGAAPPWNWSLALPPTAGGKGTNALDPVDFLSPPYGYAATMQPLGAGDNAAFASLQKGLTSGAAHLDYSFSVFVKELDDGGAKPFPFARFVLNLASSNALFIDLTLGTSGLALLQAGTGSDGGALSESDPVSGSLAANQWVRVEMLLDRSPTPWTVTVLVDGAVRLAAQKTIASPSGSGLEVDLGLLDVVPPSNPNALTFDDVVVRAY